MAITSKTYHKAELFLEAIEIGNEVISNSIKMEKQTKAAFQKLNSFSKKHIENGLTNDKLTAYEIKSLENEFFIYWNEAINQDVELFWETINKKKLPYLRKSPLKELLKKGRFRMVEQWIELFNNFNNLQNTRYLNKQFNKDEIAKFKELLEDEEQKKYDLVNKCLKKNIIPFTQYLKFGEAIAFLEKCNLMLKYFSQIEREQIYEIWRSTK